MTALNFKSFRSTVTPWVPRSWMPPLRLLVDAVSNAPIGIENTNDSGPDGIWAPVDLSAAQIASPTPAMVADLNATYRLNVAPYTRYQSNGNDLVAVGGGGSGDGSNIGGAVLQTVPPGTPNLVVGPNSYLAVYAPWTIENAAGVTVEGAVYVTNRPA